MSIRDIHSLLQAHQLCSDCVSPVDALCSAVRQAQTGPLDGLSQEALRALDLAAEAVLTNGFHGLMAQASELRAQLLPLLNEMPVGGDL